LDPRSLELIKVAHLHLLEALEQSARHRRILPPGAERENNVPLLSDEFEPETDCMLGLPETSL
jgi:hypothetical protein